MMTMRQIRFHGRGGQGAVSAAALLSLAAFEDGFEAQAFPKFGSERRGAPVESYVRISDRPIRSHTQVYAPDAVVVLDATLLRSEPVLRGLTDGGLAIVNAEGEPEMATGEVAPRWLAVTADRISIEHLNRPLPNTVLLAALAGASGWVGLPALETVVRRHFGRKGERVVGANIEILREGYRLGAAGGST
ncbi:MAG: 2-oxoacid:acceptor oxidoreductase family protein [Nevskiales bacterium]|nr:2-oxoacid:acceptor oxidoreductase family protein [Nevskiales bacterium]